MPIRILRRRDADLTQNCTDTFRENSTTLVDEIVAPLNKLKIPFSSTHGVSAQSWAV